MKNCIPFCVITRNNCLFQFFRIFHVFASIMRDSRLANGFCLVERSRDRVLLLLFSIHAKLANLQFVLPLSNGWFQAIYDSWCFLTVVESMFFKVTHSKTLTISFGQKPVHKSFFMKLYKQITCVYYPESTLLPNETEVDEDSYLLANELKVVPRLYKVTSGLYLQI